MSVFKKRVKIISNGKVKGRYFSCLVQDKNISSAARPGQFINVKVADDLEPLLRRPFGVHKANGRDIEVLYEVLGKGTEILSQRKPGDYLDVIGPLGEGFSVSGERLAVIVAGGMGIAPLLFLAQTLINRKPKTTSLKPLVLIGAKTKTQILCEEEFRKLGCDVKIATDDGSRGFKGKVTELLNKILPLAISHKPLAIYACGPRPMLKEVSRISLKYNIPAQVSLEDHMACGIGACLGCVVKVRSKEPGAGSSQYKRVCKEGPVFNAGEIIWERRAR